MINLKDLKELYVYDADPLITINQFCGQYIITKNFYPRPYNN